MVGTSNRARPGFASMLIVLLTVGGLASVGSVSDGASAARSSGQPPAAYAAVLGRPSPGVDDDGDRLTNDDEALLHTAIDNPDTDGDGLMDPWEVRSGPKGAGFYLVPLRNGRIDKSAEPSVVPSEQVFESGGADGRLYSEPDPTRPDAYFEIAAMDCNAGGHHCPGVHLGRWDVVKDPMKHEVRMQALVDVRRRLASGAQGVTASFFVADPLSHAPNCIDLGAKDLGNLRAENFGTSGPAQDVGASSRSGADAANAEQIRAARSMVFRWILSAHSTVHRDELSERQERGCSKPHIRDLRKRLPAYDNTPYGEASPDASTILVSLSPIWICPSWIRVFVLGVPTFRACNVIFRSDAAHVDKSARPESRAARVTSEKRVFRRPWSAVTWIRAAGRAAEEVSLDRIEGRTLMRLIGVAVGLKPRQADNDPTAIGEKRGPVKWRDYQRADLRLAPNDCRERQGRACTPTPALLPRGGTLYRGCRPWAWHKQNGDRTFTLVRDPRDFASLGCGADKRASRPKLHFDGDWVFAGQPGKLTSVSGDG